MARAGALEAAEGEFHRLEALLSRFRDDSELSRLNRAGSLTAGPDLCRVVELALAARERTGGRFDPTVHDALVAAGYDRTFEDIAPDSHVRCQAPDVSLGDARVVDGRIELDAGVRLDLGGIGKGYAAERAAEILATAGPCLVNAGGDIAVRGGSWPIGVETATEPLTLELSGGGLATSGRDRRRWRRDGRELHHLIDPRTGAPGGNRPAARHRGRAGRDRGRGRGEVALPRRLRSRRARGGRRRRCRRSRHRRRSHDLRGRVGGVKTDPTFWILARASGLTAYVLLTGSVLAGLAVKSRPFGRSVRTASATDVHRFLALLGLGMLVLHGVALTLDQTVHMPPAALARPRPLVVPPGSVASACSPRSSLPRRRLVLAAAAHRREELAQAALGSPTASSSWPRSTD